eukprot:Sdes_comp19841_c0_seq2m12056
MISKGSLKDTFRLWAIEAQKFPMPKNTVFSYGTAGFRMNSNLLDSIMFRIGILAALRSKSLQGSTIGLMITASHNPVCDNGIKIVDPLGEMLNSHWETYCKDLCNSSREEDFVSVLENLVVKESIDMTSSSHVIVGYDTRPSSVGLCLIAENGLSVTSCCVDVFRFVTTPQLHYLVRCYNSPSFGENTEDGYFKKLARNYLILHEACRKLHADHVLAQTQQTLFIDCSNGVGGVKMARLFSLDFLGNVLKVQLVNDGSKPTDVLNEGCGADFVKVHQTFPGGLPQNISSQNARVCALDGDADRLIYFYFLHGKFRMLDGDKQAALFAVFLQKMVQKCHLSDTVTLGVVQTAYANGGSTKYLQDCLQCSISCTPTGVKYLHREATLYDIGIYFEANGHGTVVFSEQCLQEIEMAIGSDDEAVSEAALHLKAFSNLVNQAVGDGIADMLAVDIMLLFLGWSMQDWDQLYQDLPNRLMKVSVENRQYIETADAERKTTRPQQLQLAIDTLVAQFSSARSFVRPSGTENVVRVYAEAETQEMADQLALLVSRAVYDLAHGVGGRP